MVVVDARNVIASGVAADVRVDAVAPSTTTVTLASSNYATVVDASASATATAPGTAGNQTAEPLLAAPTGGFFTQLAGSPTIDAGTTDSLLGATDIDGGARVQNAAVDIGADEVPDTTAPDTTINDGPTGATKDKTPTFAFSASEGGATFECQVDQKPYEACSSPLKLSELKDGKHEFRVRAVDANANADPTPAERSFEVDTAVDGAKAKAKGSQKQGGKAKLKVAVSAGETVEVSGKGSVVAGGKKLAFLAKRKTLPGGKKGKLVLKATKGSSNGKIAAALQGGGKLKAKVTVTFVDKLGNKDTRSVKIKLKAG